jgi:SWI/SNF-related matrix-associated actin-dependent regulator 1 of chromatin subfamily A
MKLIYPSNKTLYPFQIEAIEKTIHFLRVNPTSSCYNACEMGLGKTIQAIVALNTLGYKKVLVVCPAIMRLVWADEIRAWSEPLSPSYTILKGSDITGMFKVPWNWLITSYDLASSANLLRYLQDLPFDAIICDEAHYLKNSKAKRTKAVLQHLFPKAKYHLALSGTPFTTRIVDGYTLFHRMLPSRFPDFPSFADEFSHCRIMHISGRAIRDYYGVKNADVLRTIIRQNFYVRYTKEEVLKDLPPKQFNKIALPVEYAVVPKEVSKREELETQANLIRQALEAGNPAPPLPASLAEHRRLQGEKKVPAVIEFVQNLLDQDIPVVLFAWHRNVIAALHLAFGKYNPGVITGDTAPGARRTAVAAFQSGETLLFIGNMGAAGVGITLTTSSTVVLAELDWSPTVVSQAIDRLHRIGQRDVVNVYYFSVENSLDESIEHVLMNRVRDFKKVLE